MVVTYKDWTKKLPFALQGYRTSIQESTRATPFSLVYRSEAVLPIEMEIQSLRVLVETKASAGDQIRERCEQLALIDEKRMRVLYHVQGYQKKITRAFIKKLKSRNQKEKDLVLKELRGEISDPRGKMKPRQSIPFVIKKIMLGGAMKIADLDVKEKFQVVNMDRLQKYNP